MTTPTPRLLPPASTGCGCCAPATPSGAASAPVGTDTGATPETAVYQVTGMTCGHCIGSVTDAVNTLPQVDDVHINLVAEGISTVSVTGTAAPESVRQAIEAADYTVLGS